MRLLRVRPLTLLVLAAGLLLAGAAPAAAADITGTWDLPSGSVATQSWTFTAGSGTLAGEGGGGPYTWPMEGTISGNTVQIKTAYRETSYTAYFVGTVAADGSSMSGTWSTGGFADAATSTQTWIANRRTTTPGAGKNASGVFVLCNRGPNPGDDSICTATVGDAGANPTQPTGSVTFTAGDGGTFRLGPTCTLQPAPGSPTVASCSVTYVPPPGGGFPDVTATYAGDGKHAGAVGRTQLLSGAVFGLADGTPITEATCSATAAAATGRAKKASAAYRRDTPNPLTNPVAGVGDYLGYCGTNFALNAYGGLVRLGQISAVVAGTVTSAAGGAITIFDPEPVGKVAGVSIAVAGPVIAVGGVYAGEQMVQANDRALADPPDKRFRVTVNPVTRKRIVVRAGKGHSGAAARRLTALIARQARVASLAGAFAAAVDKAGGARQAKQPRFVGLQTRAAIDFARSLADQLDLLVAEMRKVPALVSGEKAMRLTLTSAQLDTSRARLGRSLPARLTRPLRRLGWSAADLRRLRSDIARKPDPAQVPNTPTTLAAALSDEGLLKLFERTALAMRYYTVVPTVVADSKLK